MAREEEIIEAGIEYSIQNSPYCISGDNFYEKARELNRNKSFEAGVIWADKNPKSPWISVEDDLPCNHKELLEDYGEELLKDYGYETVAVIIKSKYSKSPSTDFMRRLDKGNWVWMRNLAITHWMPFPEPPKE